jgi:hypothetical protein
MSIELDRPGGGVAAFMLSISTLVALEKNGTLADDELADIVKQSLATLKTIDVERSVRSQTAIPRKSRSWSFTPRSIGCAYCHHPRSLPRQTTRCE